MEALVSPPFRRILGEIRLGMDDATLSPSNLCLEVADRRVLQRLPCILCSRRKAAARILPCQVAGLSGCLLQCAFCTIQRLPLVCLDLQVLRSSVEVLLPSLRLRVDAGIGRFGSKLAGRHKSAGKC